MTIEPTLIEQRTPVLLRDPMEIAAFLVENPDRWYKIGEGEAARRGTFQQTAHRIKRGTGAFWPREGGVYEAVVKLDRDTGMVSLNARWARGAGAPADVALQSVE